MYDIWICKYLFVTQKQKDDKQTNKQNNQYHHHVCFCSLYFPHQFLVLQLLHVSSRIVAAFTSEAAATDYIVQIIKFAADHAPDTNEIIKLVSFPTYRYPPSWSTAPMTFDWCLPDWHPFDDGRAIHICIFFDCMCPVSSCWPNRYLHPNLIYSVTIYSVITYAIVCNEYKCNRSKNNWNQNNWTIRKVDYIGH